MRIDARVTLLVVTAALPGAFAGCGGDDDPRHALSWDCPPGWVPSGLGGCGPAVWLCEDGAGCGEVDPPLGSPVVDEDGAEGRTFGLGHGGEVIGGWPDAEAAGALAPGWAPEGGVDACPEGWSPTADGACDPRLRSDCPEGAEALPGGSCTATALADCPAAAFPAPGDLPDGATVLHVLAAAAAGGDGSVDAPFATLADALAVATGGAVVLIGEGSYPGTAVVDGELRLHGLCAAKVTIGAAEPGGDTVTAHGAADLLLTDVTLVGEGRGLVVTDGASVVARRLAVRGTVGRGVAVEGEGSRLEMSDAVVSDTRLDADMLRGNGLRADGGTIIATRVALVRNHLSAAAAVGGGEIRVADSVIRDTEPETAGGTPTGGSGVGVDRATATVERTVVDHNTGEGILVMNGEATLADVVVRRSRPRAGHTVAALVSARSSVHATRVLLEDNAQVSVLATGDAAQVVLEDSVVRGTAPGADGRWGFALFAQDGGRLEARRVRAADNADRGAYAAGPGTALVLQDVSLGATAPRADGTHGFGVVVERGASLDATRALVTEPHGAGMLLRGAGTSASLTDVAIVGVRELVAGGPGIGLVVEGGAVAEAHRLRVERAAGLAVAVVDGAEASLRQVVLRETLPHAGAFGRGLEAQSGARVRLSGARIERLPDVGVTVLDAGTRLTLTDSLFEQVGQGTPLGRGLYAGSGATLDVRRVLFRDVGQVAMSMSGRDGPVVATLQDVLVGSVAPGSLGYGLGLLAQDAVQLDARRVALRDVAGAGLALVPRESEARGEVTDLWVRNVGTSTIALDATGDTPVGRPAAYGLHVTGGSSLAVTQAVLAAGGYGFHAASGTLELTRVVVTGQLDAAGSRTEGAAVRTQDLDAHGNADDAVVQAAGLPSATALPEPTGVCVSGAC